MRAKEMIRRRWRLSRRGQSLVEFALVLPLLLVILLGVADFGRVFAAGITVEAAARNAAEVGAIERLRNRPPDPVANPGEFATYYANLHELVAATACSETRLLPNSTFSEADRTCPEMPVIRVCVRDDHDGAGPAGDPSCGDPIPGYGPDPLPAPPSCKAFMEEEWDGTSGGADGSHSVEVRVCYRFTTLFNLHVGFGWGSGINLGDVWLKKTRVFVLDCPPGDVTGC